MSDDKTEKLDQVHGFSISGEEDVPPYITEIEKYRGALPDYVKEFLIDEYGQSDYTLPGYNYVGPGTHLAENILNSKYPVNQLDEIALHHDLDMLLMVDELDALTADRDAIEASRLNVSYKSDPIAKAALENLLGKGLGPSPKPDVRMFKYLLDKHLHDTKHDNETFGFPEHYKTSLSKAFEADESGFLNKRRSSHGRLPLNNSTAVTEYLNENILPEEDEGHDYFLHDDM